MKDDRIYLLHVRDGIQRIFEYFGINLQLVWDVVERDLPSLKLKIAQLLNSLDKTP